MHQHSLPELPIGGRNSAPGSGGSGRSISVIVAGHIVRNRIFSPRVRFPRSTSDSPSSNSRRSSAAIAKRLYSSRFGCMTRRSKSSIVRRNRRSRSTSPHFDTTPSQSGVHRTVLDYERLASRRPSPRFTMTPSGQSQLTRAPVPNHVRRAIGPVNRGQWRRTVTRWAAGRSP
jgi:hypothetical protein